MTEEGLRRRASSAVTWRRRPSRPPPRSRDGRSPVAMTAAGGGGSYAAVKRYRHRPPAPIPAAPGPARFPPSPVRAGLAPRPPSAPAARPAPLPGRRRRLAAGEGPPLGPGPRAGREGAPRASRRHVAGGRVRARDAASSSSSRSRAGGASCGAERARAPAPPSRGSRGRAVWRRLRESGEGAAAGQRRWESAVRERWREGEEASCGCCVPPGLGSSPLPAVSEGVWGSSSVLRDPSPCSGCGR